MQTRDEVEQGDEKLKEMESELQELGLYDSDFSLGDLMEEAAEEDSKPPEPTKKKLPDFPVVEGEESVVEYVGQYKKQCLSKKALLKTTKERLEKDKATGHETLFKNIVECGSNKRRLKYNRNKWYCMCLLLLCNHVFDLFGVILGSWIKERFGRFGKGCR